MSPHDCDQNDIWNFYRMDLLSGSVLKERKEVRREGREWGRQRVRAKLRAREENFQGGWKEGRKIAKYNYGGRTKGEEARQCEQCHFRLSSSLCLSGVLKFGGERQREGAGI